MMNIYDLLINDNEQVSLSDIILDETSRGKLTQLIKEHHYIEELHEYGLPVSNKVLLHGSSGCGKTLTAKAIAKSLGKSILILNLSNIVNSRIGETSRNIKMVFDKAGMEKSVLFLDEFDQIGKARGRDDKDVGEMRRLVNTIIQLLDYFPEKALLIGATNHHDIIDTALLRRFQLKINFEKPAPGALDDYYDLLLSRFPQRMQTVIRKYDISFAEAKDYTYSLIKAVLIKELEKRKPVEL